MVKIASDLLRAHHIGVRELKEHLSMRTLNSILIVTDRGVPISVNLPYSDMLELVDIIDEISDPETIATIQEGRKAIKSGAKGKSVSILFKKLRGNA